MTREICGCCGRINPVGFSVTDALWEKCVPPMFSNRTLCLICFAAFADEHMVQWEDVIRFYPVSLATHLKRPGRDLDGFVEALRRT